MVQVFEGSACLSEELIPASSKVSSQETLNAFIDLGFPTSDVSTYVGALKLLHRLISSPLSRDYISESLDRWKEHQRVAEEFATLRERSGISPRVFGFFEQGIAEEVSLFGNCPEGVSERFETHCGVEMGSVIIGWGPEDLSLIVRVKEDFPLNIDQDFGWEDWCGVHMERYSASSREYVRESMTGRTCYRLVIDDMGVAIPILDYPQ